MSLKDQCAIVGVGMTKLGKKAAGISTMDFALEGCKRAIEDAGLTKDEVDGLLFVHPSQQGERHGFAGRVADLLGISSNFTATVDCGGSTPIAITQMAAMAVNAGMCHTVVCCYGWQNNPIDVPLALPPGVRRSHSVPPRRICSHLNLGQGTVFNSRVEVNKGVVTVGGVFVHQFVHQTR